MTERAKYDRKHYTYPASKMCIPGGSHDLEDVHSWRVLAMNSDVAPANNN